MSDDWKDNWHGFVEHVTSAAAERQKWSGVRPDTLYVSSDVARMIEIHLSALMGVPVEMKNDCRVAGFLLKEDTEMCDRTMSFRKRPRLGQLHFELVADGDALVPLSQCNPGTSEAANDRN